MTQETFNEAIKLHDRLQELTAVKKGIEDTISHKLSYLFKSCTGDWITVCEYEMRYIADILDRHDKMIREDIDKEIEDINRQIAGL